MPKVISAVSSASTHDCGATSTVSVTVSVTTSGSVAAGAASSWMLLPMPMPTPTSSAATAMVGQSDQRNLRGCLGQDAVGHGGFLSSRGDM